MKMGLVLLINFDETQTTAAVQALAEIGLRAQACRPGPQLYRWIRLKPIDMAWVVLPMTAVEDAFLLYRLRRAIPGIRIGLLVESGVSPNERQRFRALGAGLVLRRGIRPAVLALATKGLLS